MKKFTLFLILFFVPIGFCFGESSIDNWPTGEQFRSINNNDDDITRSMTVPFTEKCLSDLTYIIGDTAHMRIYSSLTLGDELKIYDDLQLLDPMESVIKLKVFLNSFGGGAYAGFAIADQLKRVADRFEVSMYASGVVASAAVAVFIAVENRFASEDAFFMVHEIAVPSTAGMSASDVKSMDKLFDKLTNRYIKNLVRESNKTEDDWSEMMKAETWFSAQEALDWGLVKAVK